ncbi:PLP-dependent aminotransferase family protein [Notoacmeibacter sp. MSK16QG-6]|uniref:aminotransferase-like domain-containing protein n=1 Tax=Notoacmeibacter sp. MSK16QG-6 TaxID=2957982 RepID=UPI00209F6E39|nr:PLP-dependent aminotransferase family protein [Notoacmeibacter sp. MSK16QG-6]MCP1200519.1 PLP-dependent aminotransferase family protein [Notoacmeibacter sp. MSK16QG-6]
MSVTKTERIFQSLRQRIESGELQEGAKLMSLRHAAESFGVSKNIIVAAYDRLVAQGWARSRQGAGFFVSRPAAATVESVNFREARDSVSLLHAQLERSFEVLVGDGRPPESWLLNAAPAITLGTGERGYGGLHGLLALREYIAASHVSAGIRVAPAQVVTTFGANHALDLVIRRFASRGDTVLVDDPGYYPLFAKLKLAGVNFIGIPRGPAGPDPDALSQAATAHRPRLFFTQSLAQNPTGWSYDLPTAHAVLKIAERLGMFVVDDDPFIDLPGVDGVRLASLDQFERVIQIGTFSKILSPSLRSGYLITAPQIATSLAELKMVLTVSSSSFTERLIAEVIRSRRFEKQRNQLAKRLARERDAGLERLATVGMMPEPLPAGGLYGWLALPDGFNDLDVARQAAKRGIFLAPGTLFRTSEAPQTPALRLNWSRVNDSRFFSFLRGLS